MNENEIPFQIVYFRNLSFLTVESEGVAVGLIQLSRDILLSCDCCQVLPFHVSQDFHND